FLGLTLGCARCHDHKFDAIPTRDYYRLQCAFTTTARDNVMLTTRAEAAAYRKRKAEWSAQHKAAQEKLKQWLDEQKKPHEPAVPNAKVDALPISEAEKKLLKEQPTSEAAKQLAKKHERALAISEKDFRRVFSAEQCSRWDELKNKLDAVLRSWPQ